MEERDCEAWPGWGWGGVGAGGLLLQLIPCKAGVFCSAAANRPHLPACNLLPTCAGMRRGG